MSVNTGFEVEIETAARWIVEADALLVSAGAGMGVDSGLPDFRGNEGFWRAYPPYAKLGLKFAEMANPRHFLHDPALAWGFYGHRTNLYRTVAPHAGFGILRRWIARKPRGGFVFTSNVDSHFQRAGFDSDRIVEIHGSCEWRQCTAQCCIGIFPAGEARHADCVVDEETMRCREPLPACPQCGALARPNILMFGDWHWIEARTMEQERRLQQWLWEAAGSKLVVVECGAGTAVPTVRLFSEQMVVEHGAQLIRINLRESTVPAGEIGLPMGALDALRALDSLVVE